MRGRKAHPTAIRLLRGNPSKSPVNPAEPQPDPVTNLEPPDWIDGEAQAEWRRLAPMLARLGVLTESDTVALTAYCEAWATWKGATQQIRKWGMVLKAKDGQVPVVSPYVKIAHHSLMHMRALLIEFGMTPSSRSRIHSPAATKRGPVSKWANDF